MIWKTELKRLLLREAVFVCHRSFNPSLLQVEIIMSQLKSLALCSLWFFGITGPVLAHAQSNPVEVNSPNHEISVYFKVQPSKNKQTAEPDGQLVYSVMFHQKKIFEDSALCLELANQPTWVGCSHHRRNPRLRSGELQSARWQDLCSS